MKQPLFSTSYAPRDGESTLDEIEQYAALDPSDLPEGNYELVDGVIVEMGAESDQNLEIVALLFSDCHNLSGMSSSLCQRSKLEGKSLFVEDRETV